MTSSKIPEDYRRPDATRRMAYANTDDPSVKPVWDTLGFLQDNFFRMLAHSPTLIGPLGGLVKAMFDGLELSVRHRELAIMHVSHLRNIHSTWEWHFEMAQKEAGITREQLVALQRGQIASDVFSDEDRTILRFVDEQTVNGTVSDATFVSTKALLNDRKLVELMILTGSYMLFGIVMETTEIENEWKSEDPLQRLPRV